MYETPFVQILDSRELGQNKHKYSVALSTAITWDTDNNNTDRMLHTMIQGSMSRTEQRQIREGLTKTTFFLWFYRIGAKSFFNDFECGPSKKVIDKNI